MLINKKKELEIQYLHNRIFELSQQEQTEKNQRMKQMYKNQIENIREHLK